MTTPVATDSHHNATASSPLEHFLPAMTSTATALATQILATAAALRAAEPKAVPVAFWDFDGTLIEGDCSEGLHREDGSGFAGLLEVAILRGFSKRFAGPQGLGDFEQKAQSVLRTDGHATANALVAQAFAGAREKDLLALARHHFSEVLGAWMFPEALELWQTLEAGGVPCWVISASADFFVKGAAATLHTTEDRLHGIRLHAGADGTLSDEVVPPLTHGAGKQGRMVELLAAMKAAEPGRSFWPIVALGNSPMTDGPLLEAVAHTALPGGTPLGVIINPTASLEFPRILKPAIFRGRPWTKVA